MGNAQRVAVFVDVQNMFYSTRSAYSGKLNYDKLLKDVVGERGLVRAIAYVVQRPDIDQNSFYDALDRFGYEIRIREAKNRIDATGKPIPNKGSYEVMLAVDVLSIADKVDTIILVTGDGSYTTLVECLRSKGIRVEIVGCKGSISSDLMDLVDKYTLIPQEWVIHVKSKDNKEDPDNVADNKGENEVANAPKDDGKNDEDNIGNRVQ